MPLLLTMRPQVKLIAQGRPSVPEMVLPTIRMGFLSTVTPLWKRPHSHTQRSVSWVGGSKSSQLNSEESPSQVHLRPSR